MSYIFLGFFIGLAFIFAIGAQNIFVIEQGLKKNYIFTVCLICSLSDLLLIFTGIILFNFFQIFFTPLIEIILNILLIVFLLLFIWKKFKEKINNLELKIKKTKKNYKKTILNTLGFTYLNPHVYSDTIFFLGNFSKSFQIEQKLMFGAGASLASFLFFFSIGYLSNYFSRYVTSRKIWMTINKLIIIFMIFIIFYIIIKLTF